jgi:hypothetical protein
MFEEKDKLKKKAVNYEEKSNWLFNFFFFFFFPFLMKRRTLKTFFYFKCVL